MADIATLGIAIDSRSAVTAKDNLGGLTAAAKNASQASQALTKASDETALSHAGLSTQAMAAQHSLRSLVEGLAQGMPITQVFGQQINHLSYAATGPSGLSGAFKDAAGAITGLVSPSTLVVGGLAAVAAAGYAVYASMAKTEIQFDDTARSIGTTLTALHQLESAASFKGIDTTDFLNSMQKFGASVYDAQNHMGGLADVFRANNTQAKSFDDYLEKAADLIKNANTDQQRLQLLQQMGLPATMQWVDFLKQGSDGIKQARAEATGFGADADAQMVAKARAFDDAWNKAITNARNGFKNLFIEAGTALDKAGQAVTSGLMAVGVNVPRNLLRDATTGGHGGTTLSQSSVDEFQKAVGMPTTPGGKAGGSVDPNAIKDQISKQQQYIGLLGQTASAEDAVRQVQLARQSASLNGVAITNAQEAALEKLAREQVIGVTAIKASIDAQNVEAATVGMSVGQAAAYTAELNAINSAKQRGMPLTQANLDAIHNESSALGQAAQNADLMKFAYAGFVQGPMQAFQQALVNGSKFFDALKAAGLSALSALSSKLADMAAQNLWKAALGGDTSGTGLSGLLGAVFGSGANPSVAGASGVIGAAGAGVAVPTFHTGFGPGDSISNIRFVHPAYFDDAPRFHSGIGPGEQAAIIRTDESVLTPGQMKALGKSDGSSSGDITINMPVYNTFNNADPSSEARMRSYVDQSSKQAVQAAVQQVQQIKNTTPAYLKGGR